MRRLWVVGVVMVAGLGCGDDGDGNSNSDIGGGTSNTVSGKLDRINSELEEQISVECECYESAYDSKSECIDDNQVDTDVFNCVENAIEGDNGASEFLDCLLQAERGYTGCVKDLTCDEAESDEECFADYNDSSTACLDELSSSASSDVESCFGDD